jgi:hypothetical protein
VSAIRMSEAQWQEHQAKRGKLTLVATTDPKPRKYRNTPKEVDGQRFDSAKEANRFVELRLMLQAGQISDLKCQVPFELIPAQDGERAVSYVADFTYTKGGLPVVEDVKSAHTRKLPVYVLKRKLMKFRHGITVQEV